MKSEDKIPQRRFAAILAILLIVAMVGVVPCITLDGKSYYLQLRSIVYGGDASYYDELLYHSEGHVSDFFIEDVLPSGYVRNWFPLGFAVILTPFFLLGHGLAMVLHGIGWGPPPNGYTHPEVILTLLVSAGLGSIGVWLSGKIACKLYGVKAGLWATLGLWLASPLPIYLYAQPSFAHSLSVLTSCLVLIIWLSTVDERIMKRGLALGLAIGLATLVRWQDGTYLLLPLCDMIRCRKRWKFQGSLRYSLMVGLGFLIAVFPQILLWKIQFGNWITIPQGQGFMHWWDPQIIPVLFGARHGLISWTPIIAIPFLGLIWMVTRKPAVGAPLLVLLIIQVYVNSVVMDWWAGWSFGGRRFLDLVPFFILATAFLFHELPERLKKLVPIVVSALIIWNMSLMFHYVTGHVDFGGNVPFGIWCQENWKLLIHKPIIAIGGVIAIAGLLWLVHHLTFPPSTRPLTGGLKGRDKGKVNERNPSLRPTKIRWLPATWMMVLVIAYSALWSVNLARTTEGIERIQVLNQKPLFREWMTVAYRPPFQGSALEDIASHESPWKQLASWSVEPSGTWKLVTTCDGDLSPGDTAAVLTIRDVGGATREEALIWEVATGPSKIPVESSPVGESKATVAYLDLPPDIKTTPFRTFKPLPWYIAEWARFARDYRHERIPLNAAYEYTFTLPDNFMPKSFEIHPQKAYQCYIYGIGRVEDAQRK